MCVERCIWNIRTVAAFRDGGEDTIPSGCSLQVASYGRTVVLSRHPWVSKESPRAGSISRTRPRNADRNRNSRTPDDG